MRIFAVLAVVGAAMNGAAQAQAVFGEFVAGAGFPHKIQTDDVDEFVGPDQYVGVLSGDYQPGISGGLEFGLRGVGDKHVSLSASYDYLQANLEDVVFTGTQNGMPVASADALNALDFSASEFDEAHFVLGNVRFDFVGPQEVIQPFLEVGGGIAMIENLDTTAALAGTAGFRVPLGRGFYAGARYRYIKIYDNEDMEGIDYRGLSIVSFMLGGHM